MALSTVSFNVLLHPDYINLQEKVYENKGQEGYAPMPLKDREVLEGQVIALVPSGYSGEGNPCIAYPDAAGMSKDPQFLARWMHDVKWVVNQRKAFLDHVVQPLDVTIVPGVREPMLHTGCRPLSAGDYVYVRFPIDDDVDAQRNALSHSFGGLATSRRPCPPLFATYGVSPGTVDSRARMYECMDRYKRYLTSNHLDGMDDGEIGTVAQIELSKVARVGRLLAFLIREMKHDALKNDVSNLVESIEPEAAGEDSALSKYRESNLFKTSQGVQFTSKLLAMLEETDSDMYESRPIGQVLQSLEPGSQPSCILPGHKMAVKLFLQ